MSKRIGILGGSFDPIHNGHLLLAEEAAASAELNSVILMPTYIQPFKQDTKVTAPEHRLCMTKIAACGNEFLEVSSYEIDRADISYTANTLSSIRESYDEDTFLYFIVGSDMFMHLEHWLRADYLLENFGFIVGMRECEDHAPVDAMIDKLNQAHTAQIIKTDNVRFDVSSTEIKQRVCDGRSIRYLVPDGVREYIYEHRLYV